MPHCKWRFRSFQSPRKKLIKECDDIFRILVLSRDKACQKTFRKENLQLAHFFTRRILRTRWDFDNACILSAGAHIFWAHVYPDQFREFWIKRLGQERFTRLELKAGYPAPVKQFDIELIRDDLKKRLEENLL